MRTELAVRPSMQLNVDLPVSGDEITADKIVASELGSFPKPTLDQLEESLEERVIPDRRVEENSNADVEERRATQRRKSD